MMFVNERQAKEKELVYVKFDEDGHDVHLDKISKHIHAHIWSMKDTR